MTVSLGLAGKFTTYSSGKLTFKPKTSDIGKYTITFELKDNNPNPKS